MEAPINEVLAAGIILQTGWHGECDLVDPMCGSGTFLIEAAMIASGIAPGVYSREYAFEKWPDFDKELFDAIYEDDSAERPFEHHIYGYDINHKAIAVATENVRAAGLSKYITLQQRDIKDFTAPVLCLQGLHKAGTEMCDGDQSTLRRAHLCTRPAGTLQDFG